MIGLHSPSTKYIGFNELKYSINNGWLSSIGPGTKTFEKYIKKYTKSKYVVATINGTAALQLSIACLYPKKSEEILIPDLSFISTVNAVHYNFCKPVFLGINPDFMISENALKNFINEKTFFKNGYTYNKITKKKILALIVVNVFGNLPNIFKIKKILKGKNIKIIEDAAESLGSFYLKNKKRTHSGTVGDIGCLSFNVNKIITTGGGGMILTKNLKTYKIIKHLANQSKLDPINFIHDQIGFNYSMPSINASIGIGQIKKINTILKLKKGIYKYYLSKFSKNKKIEFISVDQKNYSSNFWLNLVRFKNKNLNLNNIISKLKRRNIIARPIWFPLSLQTYNKNFQRFKTQDTKKIIKNVLCLPSGYDLTKKELQYIIEEINNIS